MNSIINARRLSSFLLCSLFSWVLAADPPQLPDREITPGDVLTSNLDDVCTSGYSKSVRNVPSSVKQEAYKAYGIYEHGPGEYEVDHLISLELGGSNSIKNLWPESYITKPLNARVKDKLENRLHTLVCRGSISLPDAQREIAENWISAYEKYIGPLPNSEISSEQHATGIVEASQLIQHSDKSSALVIVTSCPATSPIKVSKRGIFHAPGTPNYERTKPIACFDSSEAAIAAGFRATRN